MEGWIDGQMASWTGRQTNGQINRQPVKFCSTKVYFQKVLNTILEFN
jgi:hypothetical protein